MVKGNIVSVLLLVLGSILRTVSALTATISSDGDTSEGGTASFLLAFSDAVGTITANVVFGDGGTTTVVVNSVAGTATTSTSHQYLDDGTYTVEVQASDDAPSSDDATTIQTVTNVAPTFDFLSSGGPANEGDSVNVLGIYSDPGLSDTHSLFVDWGDGSSSTPAVAAGSFSISHTYEDDVSGTISLTLTDDDGDSVTNTVSLAIANVAPTIDQVLFASSRVNENDFASMSGQISDPGALDTHSMMVNWGDGDTESIAVNAVDRTFSASHQYLDDDPSGTAEDDYTIFLTLTDDDGGQGGTTEVITIVNVAPSFNSLTNTAATAGNVLPGGTVTFSGNFVDSGSLDTHSIAVDFGDGDAGSFIPSGSSFSFDHVYANEGTYTASVTISDDDTGSSSMTTTVNIGGDTSCSVFTYDCNLTGFSRIVGKLKCWKKVFVHYKTTSGCATCECE